MIAAETAEAYAKYIGGHDGELLALNNHTIGDINPNLVQGMAQGLTPYMPNIAGMSEGQLPGFDALDSPDATEKGLIPVAKGVFSVISSDDKASVLFNGAAEHQAVLAQERFAQDFKNHVPGLSPQSQDLTDLATLQGLVDAGLHNALSHEKLNGIELEKSVYQAKSQAFDMDKSSPALCHLAARLRFAVRISPGARQAGAYCRTGHPERRHLRGRFRP